MSAAPLPAPDREAARALSRDLLAADCTPAGVETQVGGVAAAALHRDQDVAARAVIARLRSAGAPAGAPVLPELIALFLLGLPASATVLDAALPTCGMAGLRQLGLVEVTGDRVLARCELRPYQVRDDAGDITWYLPSDLIRGGALAAGTAAAQLPPDAVPGVGGASLALASFTVRRPVDRVLDLGTGGGVQALHATRHATTVVATDTSARALGFARLAAALAGVRLDLRQGDLWGPVAGQRFDQIVSNPPFVIAPQAAAAGGAPPIPAAGRVGGTPQHEYRSAGRDGDALTGELLRTVGDYLNPGGVAQLLGNWEIRTDSWRERVGQWLPEGLDAWVIQREELDPAEYAEMWLRDGGLTPALPGYEDAYRAYLDYFAARGTRAIGMGMVLVRRPAAARPAARLRRLEELSGAAQAGLGDHIAACLEAHDWLAGVGNGLVDAHLRVAGDVTEERYYTPGAADPSVILLRQGGGFSRAVPVSTSLAAAVGACDGELSVGQIAGALAHLEERPVSDVLAELMGPVRELLATGLLLPEG